MTDINLEWLKIAQKLALNHKVRIPHDCGGGDALVINNQPKGYNCYCHRCGFKDFIHKGQRSFAEIMQQRTRDLEDAASIRGSIELPSDFTLTIPPEAMLWLFKASITPYIAKKHSIGWSKRYQRVVLPVYNNNNLVYYQARAIHEYQTIKYLNPSVDRTNIAYWVVPPNSSLERVVITEDILSAIRVGMFVPTVSLLGTKINVQQANAISKYRLATTWLDPDKAGIDGAISMRKTLNMVMQTSNMYTLLDPKLLTNEAIRSCLKIPKT